MGLNFVATLKKKTYRGLMDTTNNLEHLFPHVNALPDHVQSAGRCEVFSEVYAAGVNRRA